MRAAPPLTPRDQLVVPELDRGRAPTGAAAAARCCGRCARRTCTRRRSPMPDRDYPCTVCGRLRIDWTHWYYPPTATTHIMQCGDCQLILGSAAIAGDRS